MEDEWLSISHGIAAYEMHANNLKVGKDLDKRRFRCKWCKKELPLGINPCSNQGCQVLAAMLNLTWD